MSLKEKAVELMNNAMKILDGDGECFKLKNCPVGF